MLIHDVAWSSFASFNTVQDKADLLPEELIEAENLKLQNMKALKI